MHVDFFQCIHRSWQLSILSSSTEPKPVPWLGGGGQSAKKCLGTFTVLKSPEARPPAQKPVWGIFCRRTRQADTHPHSGVGGGLLAQAFQAPLPPGGWSMSACLPQTAAASASPASSRHTPSSAGPQPPARGRSMQGRVRQQLDMSQRSLHSHPILLTVAQLPDQFFPPFIVRFSFIEIGDRST